MPSPAPWPDGCRAGRRCAEPALAPPGVCSPRLACGPSQAAPRRQDDSSPYVVIRTYQEIASIPDLQKALGEGYAPLLAQQPGFLGYAVLDTDGGLASITAFASQPQEEAAANAVSDWVQQNLANLLPSPDEVTSGSVFVQSLNRVDICRETPAGPTPPPTQAPAPPTAAPPTAAPPTAVAAHGSSGLHRSGAAGGRLPLHDRDARSLRRHHPPLLQE